MKRRAVIKEPTRNKKPPHTTRKRNTLKFESLEPRHLLAAGIWAGNLDVEITTDLLGSRVDFSPGSLEFLFSNTAQGAGQLTIGSKGATATIPWFGEPENAPPGGVCSLGQIVITRSGTVSNRVVIGQEESRTGIWGWKGEYSGSFESDYSGVSGTWQALLTIPSCDEFEEPIDFGVAGTWSSVGEFVGDVAVFPPERLQDGSLRIRWDVLDRELPASTPVVVYWASGGSAAGDEEGFELQEITRWAAKQTGSFSETIDKAALENPPEGATHIVVVADPTEKNNLEPIDDPLGLVHESNEDNNVARTLNDHEAISLSYVKGATIEEDELHFTYLLDGPLPENSYVNVYWAREPQHPDASPATPIPDADEFNAVIINSALSNATSVPLTAEQRTSGQHTLRFKTSNISAAAPAIAHRIIAQIESGSGGAIGNFGGDITEIDEANNFAQLDKIRPDLHLVKLEWHPTAGGVNVDYRIDNRFFLADRQILVKPQWGDLPATFNEWAADPNKETLHIPPSNFVAPGLLNDGLRVLLDPDNTITEHGEFVGEEDDNQEFVALKDLVPTLTIEVAGRPERKKPYDVRVVLHNNAPVPMKYEIGFVEDGSAPVADPEGGAPTTIKDTNSCSDWRDISTCTLNAIRRTTDEVELGTIPFNGDKSVSLALLDDVKEAFNRTWKWIPNKSEIVETTKSIWEKLKEETTTSITDAIIELAKEKAGKAADFITAFEELVTAAESLTVVPRTTQASIDYDIKVNTLAAAGVTTEASRTVELKVASEQLFAANSYEVAASGLKFAFTKSVEMLDNIDSLLLEGEREAIEQKLHEALDGSKKLIELYDDALDPPDANFTEIVEPELPTVLENSANMAHLLRHELLANRRLQVLADAISVTRDRSIGAMAASDFQWQSAQLLALSSFASQSAITYTALIGAHMLQKGFVEQKLAPDFLALQQEVAANGLSPEVVQVLESAGAIPDEIALLEQSIVVSADNPFEGADISGTWLATLALLDSQTAVTDLLTAIALRVEQLEADVLPLAQEVRDELTSLQNEIVALFEHGLASKQLRDAVLQYIARVRELVVSTNNVESLEEDLKFAYGALFRFQQLSLRPEDFAAFIDALPVDRISADLRSALQTLLVESQTALATGDFDRGLAKIESVLHLLTTTTEELDETVGGQLVEHAKYILTLFSTRPWHNRVIAADVNNDGSVSPLDVAIVLADLARNRTLVRALSIPPITPVLPPPFFDANGDDLVSIRDVLLILNAILAGQNGSEEGEGESRAAELVAAHDEFWQGLLADEIASWTRERDERRG